MIDTDATEGTVSTHDETPEEGALRRLQAVIDECEALQTRYDRLRAEGKIEPIDFMEGGQSA